MLTSAAQVHVLAQFRPRGIQTPRLAQQLVLFVATVQLAAVTHAGIHTHFIRKGQVFRKVPCVTSLRLFPHKLNPESLGLTRHSHAVVVHDHHNFTLVTQFLDLLWGARVDILQGAHIRWKSTKLEAGTFSGPCMQASRHLQFPCHNHSNQTCAQLTVVLTSDDLWLTGHL